MICCFRLFGKMYFLVVSWVFNSYCFFSFFLFVEVEEDIVNAYFEIIILSLFFFRKNFFFLVFKMLKGKKEKFFLFFKLVWVSFCLVILFLIYFLRVLVFYGLRGRIGLLGFFVFWEGSFFIIFKWEVRFLFVFFVSWIGFSLLRLRFCLCVYGVDFIFDFFYGVLVVCCFLSVDSDVYIVIFNKSLLKSNGFSWFE